MSNAANRPSEAQLLMWELRQLVKSGQYPDEQAALRSALRALFLASPQVKLRMVLAAYQSGEIGLGKAAAMLGVSQEEMKDILREAGGEIHLGPATLEELRADAGNA
jgi:predicted HTH domain antitoxin